MIDYLCALNTNQGFNIHVVGVLKATLSIWPQIEETERVPGCLFCTEECHIDSENKTVLSQMLTMFEKVCAGHRLTCSSSTAARKD